MNPHLLIYPKLFNVITIYIYILNIIKTDHAIIIDKWRFGMKTMTLLQTN